MRASADPWTRAARHHTGRHFYRAHREIDNQTAWENMVKTTSRVLVIGDIESVERKTINDKALAEFRVSDIGLRISAWEDRAKQVPESGVVIVEGYLSTRTYTHEGAQRQTTEIRATNVQAIEGTAPDSDLPF